MQRFAPEAYSYFNAQTDLRIEPQEMLGALDVLQLQCGVSASWTVPRLKGRLTMPRVPPPHVPNAVNSV